MTPLNGVAASATRLGLPVVETPASVDIVTRQTIQEQGYRTTTDTAQGAVGVLAGDSAAAPANFSMRGFAGPQVNVTYNGISTGPTDITARWMETANLEQVEFLKGPSSLMTGLNAIGGAVNYVSRQPTSGPIHSELDASLDSTVRRVLISGPAAARRCKASIIASMRLRTNSTASSTAIIGIAASPANSIIASRIRSRLSWPSNTRSGFRPRLLGHAAGAARVRRAATPSVAWSQATASQHADRAGSVGPLTIDPRTLTTNYNVVDNATGAREHGCVADSNGLRPATLRSKTKPIPTRSTELDRQRDLCLRIATADDRPGSLRRRPQSARDRQQRDLACDSRFFGMDNRLAAQLQVSRDGSRSRRLLTTIPQPRKSPVVDPVQSTFGALAYDTLNSRLDDYATALEDRLKITPEFALIGGIRLDDLTLSRDGVHADGTVPDGLPFSVNWTPVSYRAAYTYEPIHDLVFYGMFATAYNPAAAALFSVTPAQTTLLTSSRIYETGVKQILWGGRAEWTFAAYDIRQRNVFVPVNTTTVDVAGEVASKGIELAAAVRPPAANGARAPSCETRAARSRSVRSSGSERRLRQILPTPPHSSRKRRLTESSQPSGISPTGLRSPRTNARLAHNHQGVSRKTTVSARSSRRASVSL